MQKQKQKMAYKPESNTLLESYVSQAIKISGEFTDIPNFSECPGLCSIKKDLETFFLKPLKHKNPGISQKLIIKGPSGSGKSFIIQSICKEARFSLLSCKGQHFHETLKTVKSSFQNIVVLITDLEHIKDPSIITSLCSSLSKCNMFVVAEVKDNVDASFEKYGLFENTVSMENWNKEERIEIIEYYVQKFATCFNTITSPDLSQSFSEFMNTETPSEIAKKIRRIFVHAFFEGSQISKEYIESFFVRKNENSVNMDFVGGLKDIKEEIYRTILHPLFYPEKYKILNTSRCNGVLLHGPPGCGKTLIAKAVANTAKCNFLSIKGPELMSKYVGETEKRLRDVFNKAKKMAPAIIFFDEMDSVCSNRGRSEHSDRIVNQLLVLMDGFNFRGEVMLIGATNRLDQIDEAFLRPGRFDKIIRIGLPDSSERFEIFLNHTRNFKMDKEKFLTLNTDGFSGADIHGLVKEAMTLFIQNSTITDDFIDFSYVQQAYKNHFLRNRLTQE